MVVGIHKGFFYSYGNSPLEVEEGCMLSEVFTRGLGLTRLAQCKSSGENEISMCWQPRLRTP